MNLEEVKTPAEGQKWALELAAACILDPGQEIAIKQAIDDLFPPELRRLEMTSDSSDPAFDWGAYLATGPQPKPKKCGIYAAYDIKHREYQRYQCRLRGCKYKNCRKKYAKKRVDQIDSLVRENGLYVFFTLTLDGKDWADSQEAWDKIAGIWAKFRAKIRDARLPKVGKKKAAKMFPSFKYVAILEKHKKNDRPHIHGFANCYMPYEWVSKAWNECGGGVMVSLEHVTGNITDYVTKQLDVTKYVGKDNINIAGYVKKGKRVMWRSRGLKLSQPEPDHNYGILLLPVFREDGTMAMRQQDVEYLLNMRAGNFDMETGVINEKRQVWTFVETVFIEVPQQSVARCQQELASHHGEEESYLACQIPQGSLGDQCEDKKGQGGVSEEYRRHIAANYGYDPKVERYSNGIAKEK